MYYWYGTVLLGRSCTLQWYFTFECVPESGATSTPEVGSGMWPVVDLFTKTPEDFCTSIMPRIWPGTRSETQLQTELQSVTTHRSVCSLTFKKHAVASLPRTSYCWCSVDVPPARGEVARELQKSPKMVSLSGNVCSRCR